MSTTIDVPTLFERFRQCIADAARMDTQGINSKFAAQIESAGSGLSLAEISGPRGLFQEDFGLMIMWLDERFGTDLGSLAEINIRTPLRQIHEKALEVWQRNKERAAELAKRQKEMYW